MDLNAYGLAMAIVAAARQQRSRQAVADPEFIPFDFRYLKDLPVNSSQPGQIGRQRKTRNNVSEALPA